MDGGEEEELCVCSFTGEGLRFVGGDVTLMKV